jgi:hypothetical protein
VVCGAGVYGNCLEYFAKRAGDPAHVPTIMEIVLAGHLAGFAAATVMTPADRVKVTMQVRVAQAEAAPHCRWSGYPLEDTAKRGCTDSIRLGNVHHSSTHERVLQHTVY